MKRTIPIILGCLVLSGFHVVAADLALETDPATGGPGKFAAGEIRREAKAKELGDDAAVTRITLTVAKDAKAAAQSYSIRVQNEGGRRVITVRGADAVGAMYGGLDVAEANSRTCSPMPTSPALSFASPRCSIRSNGPLRFPKPSRSFTRPSVPGAVS